MQRRLGFLQGPGDDPGCCVPVLLSLAPFYPLPRLSAWALCRGVVKSQGHTAWVCPCSGSSICIVWPWADFWGQEAQLYYPQNEDRGSNPLLRVTVQIRWTAPLSEPLLESQLRHHIIPSCCFSLLLSLAHQFSSSATSQYSSTYWFFLSSATYYLDYSFRLPPC